MSLVFRSRRTNRGFARVRVILSLVMLALVPLWLWADAPAWWTERGVINPTATADDYAAVNQGQVKHIAKQAYEEFNAKLPGGAGSTLAGVWASPPASTDDYQAINLGQLKNVAKPFYDRLHAAGYNGQPLTAGQTYPWDGATSADDYALANIGQVKNLFSFAVSSAGEEQNYYLTLVSGNYQVGASGSVLPQPLAVRVLDGQGLPVANVPVSFAVTTGGGTMGEGNVAGTATVLMSNSGISGLVSINLTINGSVGAVNCVTATVPGQSVVFTEYLGASASSGTGNSTVPSGLSGDTPNPGGQPTDPGYGAAPVFTPGDDQSPITYISVGVNPGPPYPLNPRNARLVWTDVAGSAGAYGFTVERRKSGGTWAVIATVSSQTYEFVDNGLSAGSRYEYRVRKGVGTSVSVPSSIVAYQVFAFSGISVKRSSASGTKAGFAEYTDPSVPPAYYLSQVINISSDDNYYEMYNTFEVSDDTTRYAPTPNTESGVLGFVVSYEGDLFQAESGDLEANASRHPVSGEWVEDEDNNVVISYPYLYLHGVPVVTRTSQTLSGDGLVYEDYTQMVVAGDWNYSHSKILSDEYTTATFMADVKASYTAYPATWTYYGYGSNFSYWTSGAFRNLSADEKSYSIGRITYRVDTNGLSDAAIRWVELFVEDDDPGHPRPLAARTSIVGHGADYGTGSEHTIDGSEATVNGHYYLAEVASLSIPAETGGYYDDVEKENGSIFVRPIGPSGAVGFTVSNGHIEGSRYTINWTGDNYGNFTVYGLNPTSGVWIQISNGATYNYGETGAITQFKVQSNDGAYTDAVLALVFTYKGPDGSTISSETVNFVSSHPAVGQALGFPISESSGAKYRKIALNGAPLSDEKPQQAAESDQQSEETFIDALTLGLRHDTTDIYVGVPASDLSLSVRRSAVSEVWNLKNGHRPSERPDRPFGMGWTTNLAANIHFAYGVGAANPDGSNPDTATVTDENGAEYTFAILYGLGTYHNGYTYIGPRTYVPLPSSNHEQDTYVCTLADNYDGTYTFKRKYGARLVYSMTGLAMGFAADRIDGSASGTNHTYAKLDTVTDRYGNQLNYSYEYDEDGQCYTLVPATISVLGKNGTVVSTLSISQDEQGHITDVWDPSGYKVQYAYDYRTYTDSVLTSPAQSYTYTVLGAVVAAGDQETHYDYALKADLDQNPNVDAAVGNYHHLVLTEITDPLDHTYEFEYEFDHTKYTYSSDAPDGGFYVNAGLPMQVKKTTLPGNVSATFINDSTDLKITRDELTGVESMVGSYVRRNSVIDALGNQRDYDFTGDRVESLPSFATAYMNAVRFDNPRMVYYTTMTITSYKNALAAKVFLGKESFDFSPEAGMAVTQVMDFSGNKTEFAYDNAFANTLFTDAGAGATLYGHYSDPTSQKNALNDTKSFDYGVHRIMKSSVDENEIETAWTLDLEDGRRLSETIKDKDGVVLSETAFHYNDSSDADAYFDTEVEYYDKVSANFLTKKVVKKLSSEAYDDPSWVVDLVTVYVPDASSRVWKEIVDPGVSPHLNLTTEYTYDANGNKKTVKDPRGNVTTFSYDKRNRLTHVTYADGHQKQFFYDARGNKTEEIDEKGVATFWRYDALNRVTDQVVDMNGSLKAAYAATHVLPDTLTLDRSVHIVTSYTYNALNAKLTTTNPNGTVTKFEYDALQRLVKKTDDYSSPATGHFNHVTTYEYGANSGGSVFNNSGWKPTKVTDPRGYTTEVTYDDLYRPTEEKVQYALSPAAYALTKKAYDDVGNLTQVTAPAATVNGTLQTTGTITQTTYDGLRRPTTVTEALGLTGLAVVSKTEYTSTGFAWKTIADYGDGTHLNRTTTTEYDHAGRPVKVYAPAVDDALTPVTTEVTPITETRYDAAGNVSYVLNPLGARTDYTYDNRNRRYEEKLPPVTDATTGTASRPIRTTAYDGTGNVIAVQDARGFITTTEYDNARRPVTVTAPPMTLANGTTVYPETTSTYDSAGNVLTVTDANGHVTTNTYDALNRLKTSLQKPDLTNPAHDILVTNEYDAAGNRTEVIDGKSQRTEFTYDGLNRNLTVKDPANRTVTFAYDALNKVSRTDSLGQHTDYLYDARHRLTDVSYVGRTADNRHYDYDLLGQLLAVTEPGKGGKADVAYTYDALGRQTSESSGSQLPALSSQLITHIYAYDLANNRVKVTYGGTGTVLTSTYDAHNRLLTLSEQPASGSARLTTYGYDLNGNRVLLALPNAEETDTQYDPLNRAVAITTSKASGALLLQLTQTYDPVGNLTGLTERLYGSSLTPRTVTNTYDAVNRLTSEVNTEEGKTPVTTLYVYDAANNRTQKSVAKIVSGGIFGSYTSKVVTHYTLNALNQLLSAIEDYPFGGISVPNLTPRTITGFTYDANGNRLTRSFDDNASSSTNTVFVDTYTYDYENRLTGLTKDTTGGAGSYTYTYDYRTRRVLRSEIQGSTTTLTQQIFSGGVSVSEYSAADLSALNSRLSASAAAAEYIRGSDWGGGVGGLLYSVRSGVPSFKHYNSRGDVISATDATGASTWQGTYEAYGTRTQEVGTTADRQKANTKEEDPTGLLNEGFRYRDLETGVFITRDPLGFVDGPNMYAYVVQNPWSKFDPKGLKINDKNFDEKENRMKKWEELKKDTRVQYEREKWFKGADDYNRQVVSFNEQLNKLRSTPFGSAQYDYLKSHKTTTFTIEFGVGAGKDQNRSYVGGQNNDPHRYVMAAGASDKFDTIAHEFTHLVQSVAAQSLGRPGKLPGDLGIIKAGVFSANENYSRKVRDEDDGGMRLVWFEAQAQRARNVVNNEFMVMNSPPGTLSDGSKDRYYLDPKNLREGETTYGGIFSFPDAVGTDYDFAAARDVATKKYHQ